MNAFDSSELSRLRSQPQSFKPKLAVFRPHTVWSGVLNGSHDKGSRVITVTPTGTLDDILPETTLLVGEGINQERIRIKSVSAPDIEVAENGIDWENRQDLTALLYFEPFPIFNRLVYDGNEEVTFFEDYDIPYSDQHEDFEPVVNIGPAAFVLEKDCSASGTFVDLDVDASESFVIGANITDYSWGVLTGANDAWDAEFVSATDEVTGTLRFWDTGDFYLYCTVTADNGKSFTGYRPVMVRCSQDGQSGSPYFDFSVESLNGSRDTGYWSTQLAIFEDCNLDEIPRNVPVVIYGDVVYGAGGSRSTEQVPWHYSSTAHQRFVGWVREEAWIDEYMGKGTAVVFDAVGLAGVLDEIRNYPAWLKYGSSPTQWTDMPGLTVDRALYYYLRQRTTVLRLTDWHQTGDTKLMQYADIPNGRIYSSIREFVAGTIFGDIVSDRCSALWAELDGQMVDDAARSAVVTNVHELTDDDHLNEITIPTTRDRPEVSWVSIDGLYFDGSENTPLIAYNAYAMHPRGGDPETISGLVLPSTQAELNALAGRLFALRNNPFKSIEHQTPGIWPYDIAPQASMRYSGLASGTFREETMIDADFLIRSVEDQFLPSQGLHLALETETIIRDPDAIVGPNVPKADNGVEGIFPPEIDGIDPDDYPKNWPDIIWDWPDFEIPGGESPGGGILTPGTATIAAFNFDGYVYRTANFTDENPVWEREDLGLTKDFRGMEVDPFSPLYIGEGVEVNCYVIDERYVYYVEDVFKRSGTMTVTQVYTMSADSDIRTIHASFGQQGLVGIADPRGNSGGTHLVYTTDGHLGAGATWAAWQVSSHYTTQGGADDRTGVFARGSNLIYIAARTSTGIVGSAMVYEVNVAGGPSKTAWQTISGSREAGLFHFPHDNGDNDPHDKGPSGSTIIYGERGPWNTGIRAQINGGYVDIPDPQYDGNDYGIGYVISAQWLLHTYPLDEDYLLAACSRSGGPWRIFYSDDFGTTWTHLTGSSGYRYAGISGSDVNVAYLCGNSGKIAIVPDLYTGSPPTIQDKQGNIPTDFPGVGNFYFLVGG